MKEKAQDWYFTFGSGHDHENCFVKIHGTQEQARYSMISRFGIKWAFQYSLDRWIKEDGRTQAEHYNLTEIR